MKVGRVFRGLRYALKPLLRTPLVLLLSTIIASFFSCVIAVSILQIMNVKNEAILGSVVLISFGLPFAVGIYLRYSFAMSAPNEMDNEEAPGENGDCNQESLLSEYARLQSEVKVLEDELTELILNRPKEVASVLSLLQNQSIQHELWTSLNRYRHFEVDGVEYVLDVPFDSLEAKQERYFITKPGPESNEWLWHNVSYDDEYSESELSKIKLDHEKVDYICRHLIHSERTLIPESIKEKLVEKYEAFESYKNNLKVNLPENQKLEIIRDLESNSVMRSFFIKPIDERIDRAKVRLAETQLALAKLGDALIGVSSNSQEK